MTRYIITPTYDDTGEFASYYDDESVARQDFTEMQDSEMGDWSLCEETEEGTWLLDQFKNSEKELPDDATDQTKP